jgi:ankyrin repeat protein
MPLTVTLQDLQDLFKISKSATFEEQLASFIEQGGNVNAINEQDDDRTLLHRAIQKGWIESVALLLEQKADLTIPNRDKAPACLALIENTTLHNEKRVRIFNQLAHYAPHQLHVAGMRQYTPLHSASVQGDIEMVKLLLEHQADIHALNEYGQTPLELAQHKPEVFETLLDHLNQTNTGPRIVISL